MAVSASVEGVWYMRFCCVDLVEETYFLVVPGVILDSLDWVLDELYDDRWSDRKDVGVRDGVMAAVAGVLWPLYWDTGVPWGSRLSAGGTFPSAFDEAFLLGKRRRAFQFDTLGDRGKEWVDASW